MAKKITELTAATTPLAGTEVLEIVQSGANKKVTRAQLVAGLVKALVAGANITIDATNPEQPIISASGGGSGVSLPVVQELTASRNLELADINTFNVNSSSSPYSATIRAQSDLAWTADAEIHFLRAGTGNIVITAATGVTLNGVSGGSATMTVQHGAATIKRIGLNSWWIGGLLS